MKHTFDVENPNESLDFIDELYRAVNRMGTSRIVSYMADICDDMANLELIEWEDGKSAKVWTRNAGELRKCALRLSRIK